MASKKQLKNDINYLSYELISECFAFRIYHPEKADATDKTVREIVKLRNELIFRMNNPEDNKDGKKLRSHFRKIRLDLVKLVKMVEDMSKDE